jgi:hypothetical protein
MLAGNPSASTETPNAPWHVGGSIGYTCQNGRDDGLQYWQPRLPPFACKDFLRLSLAFPDCWDGENLDSVDHKAHVAYRYLNGTCPPTHPVPMMEIDLELGYATVGYRAEQLLLSTGDQAGYGLSSSEYFMLELRVGECGVADWPAGLHADYLSFWDVELLQRALDDPTCQHRENVFGDQAQCLTLAPFRNDVAMQACKLEALIPQENTGIDVPSTHRAATQVLLPSGLLCDSF